MTNESNEELPKVVIEFRKKNPYYVRSTVVRLEVRSHADKNFSLVYDNFQDACLKADKLNDAYRIHMKAVEDAAEADRDKGKRWQQ